MLPQTVATLFRAISAETKFYNCSKDWVGKQLGRERIFYLIKLYYVRDYRKTLRIKTSKGRVRETPHSN